jgi:hypothetical protein
LVKKTDGATMQRIAAGIEAAKQRGAGEKYGGSIPPKLTIPIHDGDGPRPSDGRPFGEECRGCWVMTASSRNKPGVVDVNCNPILNATEVYSGMFGLVSLDFYPFNNNGNKGVAIGLCNVQKTSDGEPLAGGATVEDDFGGGQQFTGAQPGYPTAPAQFGAPQGYPMQQSYAPPVQQQYAPPSQPYGQPAGQGSQGYQPPYGAQQPPQGYQQQPQFNGQQSPQTYQAPQQQYANSQPQQFGGQYAPQQNDFITGKPAPGAVMGLGSVLPY